MFANLHHHPLDLGFFLQCLLHNHVQHVYLFLHSLLYRKDLVVLVILLQNTIYAKNFLVQVTECLDFLIVLDTYLFLTQRLALSCRHDSSSLLVAYFFLLVY